MTPIALSVKEACNSTSISRSTIYAEIKVGNLKTLKVGRRTLLAVKDLEAWLSSKAAAAA